jgi:hypothetical protein
MKRKFFRPSATRRSARCEPLLSNRVGGRVRISGTGGATVSGTDIGLARDVAAWFRVDGRRGEAIIAEVTTAVRRWRDVATGLGLSRAEQRRMEPAFLVVA